MVNLKVNKHKFHVRLCVRFRLLFLYFHFRIMFGRRLAEYINISIGSPWKIFNTRYVLLEKVGLQWVFYRFGEANHAREVETSLLESLIFLYLFCFFFYSYCNSFCKQFYLSSNYFYLLAFYMHYSSASYTQLVLPTVHYTNLQTLCVLNRTTPVRSEQNKTAPVRIRTEQKGAE